jgi:hypothetical protein
MVANLMEVSLIGPNDLPTERSDRPGHVEFADSYVLTWCSTPKAAGT